MNIPDFNKIFSKSLGHCLLTSEIEANHQPVHVPRVAIRFFLSFLLFSETQMSDDER